MAKATDVYRCDDPKCNRVVAEQAEDGSIVVEVRHDREWHYTKIEQPNRAEGLTTCEPGANTESSDTSE